MSRFRGHFQGLYWRQLLAMVSMVLLTLFLLGASFFSLSYNYARNQERDELRQRVQMVARLAAGYLENDPSYDREDFRQLAMVAANVSDVEFLICDTAGHVLLSTDKALEGRVITMPEKMVQTVLEEGLCAQRDDLGGLYTGKRFILGVPALSSDGLATAGMAFAVSTNASLNAMWQGFIGLFFMTAFVVLMVAFMASSVTAMRQIQPIREMVQATRQYAAGDFDVRVNDYGQVDEIGELAASFNHMAESLQQTERQRQEFIANISHELKTPMTTIAGYTDGILDGTIPPQNERQYLQIISDESRRLSRMVRRMLDVSQLQVMDPLRCGGHFDICESMRRVLISMERKITDRKSVV